jgi:hypothetical protein
VECITFHTTTGRSVRVGTCGSGTKATLAAPDGSHLFAFRGTFGRDCAGPALKLVWGSEECTGTRIVEKQVPGRVRVVKVPVYVPVPVNASAAMVNASAAMFNASAVIDAGLLASASAALRANASAASQPDVSGDRPCGSHRSRLLEARVFVASEEAKPPSLLACT